MPRGCASRFPSALPATAAFAVENCSARAAASAGRTTLARTGFASPLAPMGRPATARQPAFIPPFASTGSAPAPATSQGPASNLSASCARPLPYHTLCRARTHGRDGSCGKHPVLSRKSSPRFSHEFAPIWSLERAATREQSGPLMLPMTLQFIIVMIASAINDRLQRKLDYIEEERRILREQLDAATGCPSPKFHPRPMAWR